MKLSLAVSGLLAACVMWGVGCSGADELGSDEAQIDVGSSEQALTMPVNEPGGSAQQCAAACTRISATDLSGQCCVCNGAAKKFARGPTPNMYVCK